MSKDYSRMTVTISINLTQSYLCSLMYGGTLDAGVCRPLTPSLCWFHASTSAGRNS